MVQNLKSLWIILESWQLCESDICLLLHSTIINLPSYIQIFASIIFSCDFFWNVFLLWYCSRMVLQGTFLILVRHCKLLWTSGEVFFLAKMPQCPFFFTYQATGSLRNDRQCNSIPTPPPPWKIFYMYNFWQQRYPFCIPSIDKWFPFHIASLECCIPFNYLKFVWLTAEPRCFHDFFTATKCIC